MNQDTIKDFIGTLKTDAPKSTNNTYHATVTRIDDEGVVWVSIAGSDTETPTQATSSEIKRGDSVTVQWRNNKLYIAGNYTDPSAGVARVIYVENAAEHAQKTADDANATAGAAAIQANAAKQVADNTEQHFWFTETGTDTGAHITEVTQDEWNDTNGVNYHSGGNLLARSNGIAVRDGLTELATFTSNAATIGKVNEAHIRQTSTALYFMDSNDYARAELYADSTNGFKLYDVTRKKTIRSTWNGIELVNDTDAGLVVGGGDVVITNDVTAGGVFKDGTNTELTSKSQFDCGYETVGSISTNSYKDVELSFNKTFAAAPHVVACLSSSGTAGNIGNVCVSVFGITTTGCTIRVFNNRGSSLSPAVEWIAIGI